MGRSKSSCFCRTLIRSCAKVKGWIYPRRLGFEDIRSLPSSSAKVIIGDLRPGLHVCVGFACPWITQIVVRRNVWQATDLDVRWIVREDFILSAALSRIAQHGKPVEVDPETADYMGAFEETALSATDALDSVFDTEV